MWVKRKWDSGKTTNVHQRFWIVYRGAADQEMTDGSGIGQNIRDKLFGAISDSMVQAIADRDKISDALNTLIKRLTVDGPRFWAQLTGPLDMKVTYKYNIPTY